MVKGGLDVDKAIGLVTEKKKDIMSYHERAKYHDKHIEE